MDEVSFRQSEGLTTRRFCRFPEWTSGRDFGLTGCVSSDLLAPPEDFAPGFQFLSRFADAAALGGCDSGPRLCPASRCVRHDTGVFSVCQRARRGYSVAAQA